MDISEDDLSKSLPRQRRNLLGISFILLFYHGSRISITKINLLGNEFKIEDSSWIGYVLWISWTYLLLRYYQHYRQASLDNISGAVRLRMNKYVSRVSCKKFIKSYRQRTDVPDIPLPHDINIRSYSIVAENPTGWKVNAMIHIGNMTEGKQLGDIREYPIILTRWDLLKMRIRAYIQVALHTPYVTEYHLPFLVAIIPVVYIFII